MILAERHIIKQNNKHYKELDNLCFLSKNLYNSALYSIRQYYFQNKKYLNKFQLINEFTKNNQVDYIQLPRKVSQQVICNHCNYLGTRLKRGLFKTNNGLLINADINGSLNILRKEVSNAFTDERYEIQVYSMPSVFTVKL